MWILPKPISACMPEAVDSTWDSTELCQTLSASLTWNTKPAQPRSWSIILKRNYWMRLLSTRMPSPSRQNDFTDWWTGSLADRRVSRSASQGNNSAQMTRETSGLSLSEWWDRFSQEAASLRTSHQPNLFGTSTRKSSPDFNIWATKLRAAYSQRLRLARHTTESESSFWQSPIASENEGSGIKSNGYLKLKAEAENWPTPDANSSTYSNGERGQNLRESAAMWPTPEASNGTVGEIPKKNVYILPSGRPRAVTNSGQTGSIGLAREAAMWATPMASDDEHKTTVNAKQAGLVGMADRFAGRPVQEALKRGGKLSKQEQTSLPRLNPRFVTWLMGWPDGWLRFHALKNSESLETE